MLDRTVHSAASEHSPEDQTQESRSQGSHDKEIVITHIPEATMAMVYACTVALVRARTIDITHMRHYHAL